MKILLFKLESYLTEENRFGYRSWSEMPSNILTAAAYLDPSFDIELQFVSGIEEIEFNRYDIVIQWVSLADGLKPSLDAFKHSKEFNCLNILVLFDDWEKTSLQIMQDFSYIDYSIRGLDREINIENLLNYLIHKKEFPTKGIVYKKEDAVIDNGLNTGMTTLTHLVSAKKYMLELMKTKKFERYFIKVSSGCPYPCTFCHIGLRPNRFRTVADVVDEIGILPNNAIVQLGSADILQNEQWVEEFCNEILKLGRTYIFETDIRIDMVKNDSLLILMKKAGFDQLAIGIESFDMSVSKAAKKGYTYKKIQNGFDKLIKHDLSPAINFMVGHYLDTHESLQKTADEILKLHPKVKIVGFQYLRPLPGTKIEKESLSLGLLNFPLNYRDFINIRNEPVMNTNELSKQDLIKWMEFFNHLDVSKVTNKYTFRKKLSNCGGDSKLGEKVISIAPHPISLYKKNLESLQSENVNFITSKQFYENSYDKKELNVLLRHDIDFRPSRIELFTDVEEELGLRSDIYVILDDHFYDIKPHIDKLKNLHEKGYILGLHTLAPGNDNYKEIFKSEMELFYEYFGFKPEYFTVHGKTPRPSNWEKTKSEFLDYIRTNQQQLGIKGSHNILSPYTWVEDIGINGGEFSVLRRKFLQITNHYHYGVIGLLTHPIHWNYSDIAWEVADDNWKSILD